MKKVFLLITIIFLVGCANSHDLKLDDNTKTTTTSEINRFSLEFENSKCNTKERTIYTFNDGKKIYSQCGEVYYISQYEKVSLGNALDNNLVTMDDITINMKTIVALYDGGTVVFEYNREDNVLGSSSFRLEKCNQLNGSKDLLFLSTNSNNYKCA